MARQIRFLGWDKPAAATLARAILGEIAPPLARLDNVLIVAPTRESGRRLREKMAVLGREKNAALLGAQIVTPLYFLQPRAGRAPLAGAPLVRGALIKTLLSLRQNDCPALFPRGIPPNSQPWAFATAKIIQQLRDDLSDGGMSISAALEKHAAELAEPQRWQDLGKIEKSYLENLEKTGYLDPVAAKLAAAQAPVLPTEIGKIIIAAVPDPSRLALAALETLAKRIEIEILVLAPAALRAAFDDWGRPRPEKWRQALIEIPAPEKNILMADNPAGQARTAADLIRTGAYAPADICVGVPDRAVIPYLQDQLENAGLAAFDPADRPVKDHPLCLLVQAWCNLVANSSFANLAAFLRNADILNYLQAALGIDSGALLSELDQLQNSALPQTRPDLELALNQRPDFPSLKTAARFINAVLAAGPAPEPQEALREFLEQIFALKTITDESEDDQDFKAVAGLLAGILNEITYARPHLKQFKAELIRQMILGSLEELVIPRRREGAGLDLNGWLELAWNDAPLMIITGCNEGCVPDSRQGDIFLPDTLKKALGLRNNETRLARDAYLLSLILATRRRQGRVILLAGKSGPEGDPLKPSRLLFRCPDAQLAERVEHIFRKVAEPAPKPPFSVTFKLDPAAPLANAQPPVLPVELHATQFRDYLACPFRFYLRHILKMERREIKAELDARDFGTMLHRLLEEFAGDPQINGSDDAGAIRQYLERALERYFEKHYGNNDSFPLLYARAIAGQRLKAFAEHQARAAAEGWQIAQRELAGQLTIAGVKITGKIDRVDRNCRTESMRIIDYKTADAALNPEKKHIHKSRKEIPDYARLTADGPERWLDLQMPLYWQMFRQMSPAEEDRTIELCYFNLPRANANAGLAAWENFNAALANAACLSAEKIIARIQAGVFWPPAESAQYDDYEILCREDPRDFFAGEKIAGFFAAKK